MWRIIFPVLLGLLIYKTDYFPKWFKPSSTSLEKVVNKLINLQEKALISVDSYDAKFALQWPTSVCIFEVIQKGRGSSSADCRFPPQQLSWSIHGIWNPWSTGSFCSQKSLDRSQIENITNDLNQCWVQVNKGYDNYNFWNYEWKKHGTCLSNHPNLNEQYKYFQQAINWHRQYDPTRALIQCNITPDNSKKYSNIQVTNCLKERLGITSRIMLITKTDSIYRNGESLLTEIRICFNRNSLADCEQLGPLSFDFIYPRTVENKSTMMYSLMSYFKLYNF